MVYALRSAPTWWESSYQHFRKQKIFFRIRPSGNRQSTPFGDICCRLPPLGKSRLAIEVLTAAQKSPSYSSSVSCRGMRQSGKWCSLVRTTPELDSWTHLHPHPPPLTQKKKKKKEKKFPLWFLHKKASLDPNCLICPPFLHLKVVSCYCSLWVTLKYSWRLYWYNKVLECYLIWLIYSSTL